MKICRYCGAECEDKINTCPSCSAVEFNYKCANCRTVFDSPFCPNCGVKVGTKPKKCPSCSAEYFSNACPSCGYVKSSAQPQTINITSVNNVTRSPAPAAGKKPINKWISFCLCLLLGFLGAHKFYEGNARMGVVYLFTVGLFGIGWIIDTIVILFKPNPYYV